MPIMRGPIANFSSPAHIVLNLHVMNSTEAYIALNRLLEWLLHCKIPLRKALQKSIHNIVCCTSALVKVFYSLHYAFSYISFNIPFKITGIGLLLVLCKLPLHNTVMMVTLWRVPTANVSSRYVSFVTHVPLHCCTAGSTLIIYTFLWPLVVSFQEMVTIRKLSSSVLSLVSFMCRF